MKQTEQCILLLRPYKKVPTDKKKKTGKQNKPLCTLVLIMLQQRIQFLDSEGPIFKKNHINFQNQRDASTNQLDHLNQGQSLYAAREEYQPVI
ncbi:unnamed protein product [Paramecium octaurelia]|uniref:Uncharacterized protein n=1 Tax=Paramecium octaurelia TaxID=43137 RepID=A0A8S1WWZ0_PAROT|nr:unnamed protein product [Paramecium octaurelia]